MKQEHVVLGALPPVSPGVVTIANDSAVLNGMPEEMMTSLVTFAGILKMRMGGCDVVKSILAWSYSLK
jgi:hypothetical protein